MLNYNIDFVFVRGDEIHPNFSMVASHVSEQVKLTKAAVYKTMMCLKITFVADPVNLPIAFLQKLAKFICVL